MTGKRIIGISFDEQEICVCAWTQDGTVGVLRLPAVFAISPVGEVLTGNRAVRYRQICQQTGAADPKLRSVYSCLDEQNWNPQGVIHRKGLRISVRDILKNLLQEMKRGLSATAYRTCNTCVLTVPSMDPRVQAAIGGAAEAAGISVLRVLPFAEAQALYLAKNGAEDTCFLVLTADGMHVSTVQAEVSDGLVELLRAAEWQANGDAGRAAAGLLQKLGQEQVDTDGYPLTQPELLYVCTDDRNVARQTEHSGFRVAVEYAEHPARMAAFGAALQAGKLDGWEEMKGTLLLECLPYTLGLEIGGDGAPRIWTGKWTIPRESAIPTKSKEPVCCRVAELGMEAQMTVYLGPWLSEFSGCETGRAVALYSGKLSTLLEQFSAWPSELLLRLDVAYRIGDADGIRLTAANPENGEERSISFLDGYRRPWQQASDGSQPVDRRSALNDMANAVKSLRAKLNQQMPQAVESGRNSWNDWATTMRSSRIPSERNAAVEKGLQQVLKQSETFLRKQVLQKVVSDAADARYPEELVPQALASLDERQLAPVSVLAEDLLVVVDSLEYGLRGISEHADAAERVMSGYYHVLMQILERYLDVKPVEALGKAFDVDCHYALIQESVPGLEAGIVTEELQRGYLQSGRLLRAAKVKVSG